MRAHHAEKNDLKPWLQKQWVIAPQANAEFVCAMEDVLEVYHRPHDLEHPVVCVDETSKQLVGETRTPIPAVPGRPERIDYEYERHGTANLFMLFEPLAGWRHVKVTNRRTAVDFAEVLRDLSEVHHPDAKSIVLVMDNLNTHKLASLYEAFAPAEARRLAKRFEIHYTPKHGSWLDMAETELSVLSRQCLKRRIDNRDDLQREVAAWEKRRNEAEAVVDWRFTTADARIKLKRLTRQFRTVEALDGFRAFRHSGGYAVSLSSPSRCGLQWDDDGPLGAQTMRRVCRAGGGLLGGKDPTSRFRL